MATHTTYYNLTKPSQNDKVNIGVLNDNADIIDTTLHNKVDSDDLTANNVMMSDGTTSVEDELDRLTKDNTLSSSLVSLMSYNSEQNYFTLTSDGIVKCAYNSAGTDVGQLRAILSDNSTLSIFASLPNSQVLSLYVRKGMKIYLRNSTSFYSCDFIPLT